MSGINKVMLIGNCGGDPEVRQMPNGGTVANLTVATSEKWKDKQTGQPVEKTEWHKIVFFNKLAEIVGEYIRKGSKVYIEGALRTREWEKDGVKRYSTEIVASSMQMLGDKQASSNNASPQSQGQYQGPNANPAPNHNPALDDFDDDIPF